MALSVESSACYLFVFCRSGAITRPCQWSSAIVISLYFTGLEQSFNPASPVIVTRLYFAGLEQLFDLVRGVWCLLFACILEVWRNCSTLSVVWRLLFAVFCRSYLTLSVESGDSYSLVFCIVWSNCLTLSDVSGDCRYGAIIRPCQWRPVMVICFYFF